MSLGDALIFNGAARHELYEPLLEGLVDLLGKVENQMMEWMLGVEDGGAGRSNCAEIAK